MKATIYIGLAIFSLVSVGIALPFFTISQKHSEYELSRLCGETAATWFKSNYPNGEKDTNSSMTSAFYRNHYNKKLNKCLAFMDMISTSSQSKGSSSYSEQLLDVNENKSDAYFEQDVVTQKITACKVESESCKTRDEWDRIVKPFMEE